MQDDASGRAVPARSIRRAASSLACNALPSGEVWWMTRATYQQLQPAERIIGIWKAEKASRRGHGGSSILTRKPARNAPLSRLWPATPWRTSACGSGDEHLSVTRSAVSRIGSEWCYGCQARWMTAIFRIWSWRASPIRATNAKALRRLGGGAEFWLADNAAFSLLAGRRATFILRRERSE